MEFEPAIQPTAEATATAWSFVFAAGQLLLPEGSEILSPGPAVEAEQRHYLGRLGGLDAWAMQIAEAPAGWRGVPLRTAMMAMPPGQMALASRAAQLLEWDRSHRFCGVCGTPTERVDRERARRCPACGHLAYPRIKVAIVTGAGSLAAGYGNGRAAAFALSRQGAKVALLDVNMASVEETAELIRADGGECIVIGCDVTDEGACRAAVERTLGQWGRLDILVNNVGTARVPGDATTVDLEAWERGMRINVTSMVLMTRFAVPAMRQSGGGSIINISSITGLIGGHANLFYPTSKGALLNLTRTMAGQHGPDGIRVNCICPGFMYTPVVSEKMPEGFRESRRNAGALKTEGTAWDVAFGILFLASDESRWITGVILPIDAGVTAITPHFRTSSPSALLRTQEANWESVARGAGS